MSYQPPFLRPFPPAYDGGFAPPFPLAPFGPPPLPPAPRDEWKSIEPLKSTELAAWVVILICVAMLIWINWRSARASAAAADSEVNPQIELVARYAIGVKRLTPQSPAMPVVISQIDDAAQTPVDKLATVVVIGELQGKLQALARLDALRPGLPAALLPTLDALRKLYTQGPDALTKADRAALDAHLGWLSALGKTFDRPDGDPARRQILRQARRTVAVLMGAVVLGILAAAAGLVLIIIAVFLFFDRRLLPRFDRRTASGSIYLEAFAVYLAGITFGWMVLSLLPRAWRSSMTLHVGAMIVPTAVAIVWPLLRGVGAADWRRGLGWHAGRGFFHEMAFGLVGYVAGLPILGAALFLTSMLIKRVHAHPSHPIQRMLGVNPALTLIAFVLASVWAPITEETMFRGAFFGYLRTRGRWIVSAAVSSLIFAAIHPQGWTLIPMLMSIAIVFAAIREWRGTILSSAAAHCFHNSLLLVVVLMTMA